MAGANYMGGKRNVARARSKDSTRRIQKGFFGRQRLNMLSNGIPRLTTSNAHILSRTSPGSPSVSAMLEKAKTIPVIGLAHAPVGMRDVQVGEGNVGYIPGPTRLPKTPPKKKRKLDASSSSGRSRVLEALDTEPMFLRATLNRILDLPDLAGLSHPAPTNLKPSKSKPREPRMWEDNENGYLIFEPKYMNISGLQVKPKPQPEPHFNPPPPPTPPSPYVSDASTSGWVRDNRSRGVVRRKDGNVSIPAPPPPDEESPSEQSVSRCDTDRPETSSTLPPSSEQVWSDGAVTVATTSGRSQSQDREENLWLDMDMDLDFNRQPPDSGEADSPSGSAISPFRENDEALEDHDFAATGVVPPRRRIRFAVDNLYEHEDPWHTIGVVLGLEDVRPGDKVVDADGDIDMEVEVGGGVLQRGGVDPESDEDAADGYDADNLQEASTSQSEPPFRYLHFDSDSGCLSGADLEEDDQPPRNYSIMNSDDDPNLISDIDFDALSNACAYPDTDSSTGVVQRPSLVEDVDIIGSLQSPFRILMESRRGKSVHETSSVVASNSWRGVASSAIGDKGSQSFTSSERVLSSPSPFPRTPSPTPLDHDVDIEEVQSPFRMLLASRNLGNVKHDNHKMNTTASGTGADAGLAMNFTNCGLGNSNSMLLSPSPRFDCQKTASFSSPTTMSDGRGYTVAIADDLDSMGSDGVASSVRSMPTMNLVLQEIDGVYLGPCLFPEDEESDDD